MIKRDGARYLERRYLWALPTGFNILPEAGFWHTFWQSDPDPLHDHRWHWGRIIISGRYREWHHDGTFTDCGPGHVVWFKAARELHRVELLTESATTIFWHWKAFRTWGFMRADGLWRSTPDEGQDGRPKKGWLFPKKIGAPPKEVVHGS